MKGKKQPRRTAATSARVRGARARARACGVARARACASLLGLLDDALLDGDDDGVAVADLQVRERLAVILNKGEGCPVRARMKSRDAKVERCGTYARQQ